MQTRSSALIAIVGCTLLLACGSSGSSQADPSSGKADRSACGRITQQGVCTDNVITWCFSGRLATVDCKKAYNQICQQVGGQAGWACVDPPTVEGGACPSMLTPQGTCDADHLGGNLCDAQTNTVVRIDCQGDEICSLQCPGSVGAIACCAPSAFGNPECDKLGLDGICDGNTIRGCNQSGQVYTIDCGAAGRTCSQNCSNGQKTCCVG
jgi:hypothetical protein